MASKLKLKNNLGNTFTLEHSNDIGDVSLTSTQLKNIRQVDTIADLRAMTDTQNTIWVSGYHTKGDGAFGSNIFEWDATSTEDDNGGTVIKLDSVATGRYKLRYSGAVNVKWFGAKGDGVTDDSDILNPLSTFPAYYGSFLYGGDDYAGYYNLYGGTKYKDASVSRIQLGRDAQAINDPRPLVATVKMSSANRDTDPAAWDQVGYYGLVKKEGDAYGAALSASAKAYGGSGDLIGMHARAESLAESGEVFASWVYTAVNTGTYTYEAIGQEINFNNKDTPATFSSRFGTYRGLIVATADGSKAAHIGIDVGAQTGTEGWLYGVRLRTDGVVAESDTDGKTTQLQIEGASSVIKGYTGINFAGGTLKTGIDFRDLEDPISNNRAINLRPDDRIYWSNTGDTISRYISVKAATNTLDLHNLLLSMGDVQVVGTRKTGWGVNSGTATKSGFNTATVTLEELAERVKALIDDLKSHGLIGA